MIFDHKRPALLNLLACLGTTALLHAQGEVQTIQPTDSVVGDEFGVAVAVDGELAVVRSSVSAYIFERIAGVWTQMVQLDLPESDPDSNLGESVHLSATLALVGTPSGEVSGFPSGSAYLFERVAGVWQQPGVRLVPIDPGSASEFGYSVAVDEKPGSRRVVIGDPQWAQNLFSTGAAYVFEEGPTGWSQVQRLNAPDSSGGDWFGTSVALYGEFLVVGARLDDDNQSNSGSVYVFREQPGNGFQFHAKLLAPEPGSFAEFGRSVTLDDEWLAIGEIRAVVNGFSTGLVHMYRRSGNDWLPTQIVGAAEAGDLDAFGISLDLRDDRLAVGACYDDLSGIDEGAAYLFELAGNEWIQTARYRLTLASTSDLLGWSVGLSDDALLTGTLKDYGSGSGPPGEMHAFDPDENSSCVAYPFGTTPELGNALSLVTGPIASGPWSVALIGPELAPLSILGASIGTALLDLGTATLLIDPTAMVLLPMASLPGFALTLVPLPAGPQFANLPFYVQGFNFDAVTLELEASAGLRVSLCF